MVSSSVFDFYQEENDLLPDYGMENKEDSGQWIEILLVFVCFCGYMNIIYSASKFIYVQKVIGRQLKLCQAGL